MHAVGVGWTTLIPYLVASQCSTCAYCMYWGQVHQQTSAKPASVAFKPQNRMPYSLPKVFGPLIFGVLL